MKLPLYFDYAATTPVDPRVAEKMWPYLTDRYGNASSHHALGEEAAMAIEEARVQVASLISAASREIIWTSGATESINLAIKGVAHFYQNKGKHIITSKIEHKAVLATCQYLQQQGFEVSYLNPHPNGLIDIEELAATIRSDTILLSLVHVNNEIGVIQDLKAMGELARSRGVIFHVDAAQSIGKVAVDLSQLPVDLMSLASHKVYGPKGVGALYVRHKPRTRLVPILHGGGQEQGLRSGTLPTHQIVGMGEAYRIAKQEMAVENRRIRQLRQQLWSGIREIAGIVLNGSLEHSVANILNVSFAAMDGEALLLALKDLAISSGSACTSTTIEPSHVLRAIGSSDQLAYSTLRFSLGRFSTAQEIDAAVTKVIQAVTWLRNMMPENIES